MAIQKTPAEEVSIYFLEIQERRTKPESHFTKKIQKAKRNPHILKIILHFDAIESGH